MLFDYYFIYYYKKTIKLDTNFAVNSISSQNYYRSHNSIIVLNRNDISLISPKKGLTTTAFIIYNVKNF